MEVYVKYLFTLVSFALNATIISLIGAFYFVNVLQLALRILCSTLLTFLAFASDLTALCRKAVSV